MKAASQSKGIGVSIGSRCNVASTLFAEADTTGVHGPPITKPEYLEHDGSGLSPTALEAPDDSWMDGRAPRLRDTGVQVSVRLVRFLLRSSRTIPR